MRRNVNTLPVGARKMKNQKNVELGRERRGEGDRRASGIEEKTEKTVEKKKERRIGRCWGPHRSPPN